jgi:hypothetical protein
MAFHFLQTLQIGFKESRPNIVASWAVLISDKTNSNRQLEIYDFRILPKPKLPRERNAPGMTCQGISWRKRMAMVCFTCRLFTLHR